MDNTQIISRLRKSQREALKLRASACEECGSTNRLSTHHKDFDPFNNSPDNLKTLCVRCHSVLHSQLRGDKIEGPRKYAPICSVPGCERPHISKGFCTMHYARYHKHGDPAIGYHRNATSFRPGQRPHNCLYRGLTQEAVKDIDQARDAGESFAALSRRYRVAVKTVRMAYYRQSWKHVAK